MAPRGLSADEKRVKLLEIFHESKDFYQLKELEKLGPKLKGIVSQSVKEVLQSLVDDGLVQADKIGTSNFFWAFPSARGATLNKKIRDLQETRSTLERSITELKIDISAEQEERKLTPERKAQLAKLAELKAKVQALNRERKLYGASDPVQVNAKRRGIELAHEAAIRFTESTTSIVSHISQARGVSASDLRSYLEITEEWEDIA